MAGILEGVIIHAAESLLDKAIQEPKYLCCYNSYVEDFEEAKTSLSAKRNTVLEEIDEAKFKNENKTVSEVELWLDRAKGLIEEDTKRKKEWFGLFPNCFWQYKRGRELAEKTLEIKELIGKGNFPRVARSTGLPGIEFYSSSNFMRLEDRNLTCEKLKEALKDDSKFMVGLYGLGGTGKTTMAKQVGKEVEESNVFDKVIFTVVSKDDPNLKRIRGNIAEHLNLTFKEGMDESIQAQELWKQIKERGEKLLIILDDAWENLTLSDIGIPLGRHGNGSCSLLLITHDSRVCRDMGCHEAIELEVLNEKDAVDLFLFYANMSTDSSSNGFKNVALSIVKECGRLPVAIVAVASSLKSRPLTEWEQSLVRLQNPNPIPNVKEDLRVAYNSLRLSYDNLKNEKAKQFFLLCSLFPEDYEIPIELLTRVAIGLGFCGEANNYSTARSHFTPIKNELIDSCLLLKVGNEAVKMHDLVREMALWIGNKLVQAAMDPNITLMDDVQYSSWNILEFPSHFDGRKLEVLLVWINNAGSSTVKVPNAFFEGMENLKVLALRSRLSRLETSAASLFQFPLSLVKVRTLSITEFALGDISLLVNFKSLESIELIKCSIKELPHEIKEMEKLRLLEMVDCVIERNNPIEVIGSCLQLEELYYVSNIVAGVSLESQAIEITQFPILQRYHIIGHVPSYSFALSDYRNHKIYAERNFNSSRYFDSEGLGVNFSKKIFKSLMERVEVLELEAYYNNKGWTNIVPDIFSMEYYGSMKDHLTRLCLKSMDEMNCLIRLEHLQGSVAIFSKLVELKLFNMYVRKLCCGPYPIDFLKQLKELYLSSCGKLESTLFDGKLELCNLQFICVKGCSMTSLFHPSTAQSLKLLDRLEVTGCLKLKYIVVETIIKHDPEKKSHDSVFPKLEHLKLIRCPDIAYIMPICFCEDLPLLQSVEIKNCKKLKYIFGQYPMGRDLRQIRKEVILQLLEVLVISTVPKFINIYAECCFALPCSDEGLKSLPSTKEDGSNSLSRGRLCCFWPKSNDSTKHHPSSSLTTHQPNHDQALEVNDVVNRADKLFTAPLYPYRSLKEIKVDGLSGIKSLFTLSMASSLELLEILQVDFFNELEHIVVTDEEHGHDHKNVNSIFPNLLEISVSECSHLEYVLPAFYSKDFKHLESLCIYNVEKLTHVFGNCQAHQNNYVEVSLELPALKKLYLDYLPNLVSICAKNYSVKAPNLRWLVVSDCEELISIMEDDEENNKNTKSHHQVCFPELRAINVKHCKSLKCLFHISCGELPQLWYVNIEDAPQLGQIFGWKRGEKKKVVMEDVLPKLFAIRLVNLPTLHTICRENDFQTVKFCLVHGCPNISLTSTNFSFHEVHLSEYIAGDEDKFYKDDVWRWAYEAREYEIVEEKLTETPSSSSDVIKEKAKTSVEESPPSEEAIKAAEVRSLEQTNKISEKGLHLVSKDQQSKPSDFSSHTASSQVKDKMITLNQQATEPDMHPDYSQKNAEASVGETSNKVAMAVSSTTAETTPLSIPSISTPKKPQIATSNSETKPESSLSNLLDTHINEPAQDEIKVNQADTCMPCVSKQLEDDDLLRLFKIMEEGAHMEVHMPYTFQISAHHGDDSEVIKSLADMEASLKMGLNEIANSEERRLCLDNALNTLSSHCSHDGLKAIIQSLQQEIQTVLTSFKQDYTTSDTVTKFEQNEKLMIGQCSQQKGAAMTLLAEIHKTQNSMVEAQIREAELKEQISKLRDELYSKENEIKECETKLLSLQEQKKKSVSDTIGFIKELEAVKKERSQLENLESKWSSCLANLKKTSLLLGVHLKQQL